MTETLIERAKKEGIHKYGVAALLRNQDEILLLEKRIPDQDKYLYELPSSELKKDETLQQALQRVIIEQTALHLQEVIAYLGHVDYQAGAVPLRRQFVFAVEVSDPYAIEISEHMAFAWVNLQEAVGYPITDELREMLDMYSRL